jgi:2-keto-4-pentenoate hydratase/2-oxohepta-3-ene-1,7-dioic acid hydratase in catechol pathway
MKLASFVLGGRATFGCKVGDGLIDLGGRLPEFQGELRQVLLQNALDLIAREVSNLSADCAIADVEFLPLIPNPDKVLCVGINYLPHVRETGRDIPDKPVIFTRFAASQTGHEQALLRPRDSIKLDYEGELAVVIGKAGRHIEKSEALKYVAGYTCFNDGSVRDWQRHSSQFTPGKNFVKSGAMGPWLVTTDEIPDPSILSLETRLNGGVVQSADVSDLIFDIPTLIAYCATFTELLPGDVIATGTPGGVGFAKEPPVWLQPGDTVEVAISRVGLLRNSVIDE